MSQTPSVTIIIPTWNGEKYIEACLHSLVDQEYPEFDIIVVDNASTDATPTRVAEHFPMVKLIRNEYNLGFAGGVNIGLRTANGDILVLFNQDAVAHPGWLPALVSGLLAGPDIGVAGCKILDVERPTIQHAGGWLIPPLALSSHFGLGEIDEGQYDELKDVDFVTGAAMAIRREVLETVGYLDESLFFYFEDVDYCYQARRAGFRVVYAPSAVLRHHGNASLGPETVDHFRRFHASRLRFILKHWGPKFFIAEVYPAEIERLRIISFKEWIGLRQAYQLALEYVIQAGNAFSVDEATRPELFSLFSRMGQQIAAVYRLNTVQSLALPTWPQGLPEDWWNVKEQPFVSKTPVVGPLIAWFRTRWNNIATRWFVRPLLLQQNEINWRLVQILEMQSRIVNNQSQLLQYQTDLLNNFDEDQTRLTIQLSQILDQLNKIETQVATLTEKLPERH